MTLSRREFLQASGLAGTAALLAACGGDGSSPGAKGGELAFWCHNGEMRSLFKKILKEYESERGGMPTQFHYEPLTDLGKSLQLAWQSDQMPDIHTLGGLELPPAALQANGWFQPMDLGDAVDRLPKGSLVDGVHIFDDKLYSFPITSSRQYWAPVWYRADQVEKYGIDPDNPPTTYDDFRAACQKVKKASGGSVYGWMSKLGAGNHMGPEIGEIAQAAGFTGGIATDGTGGIDFRTGEYSYHADAFVNAVEFLLSLHKDGLMFPGSLTMQGTQGQMRWAAGATAFWFDGPWLPHSVTLRLSPEKSKQLKDQLRVAPMLVPESGKPVTVYHGPAAGSLWISSKSEHAAKASLLLRRHFTTHEFFTGVAETAAVPLELDAVDDAKVHPAYRQLVNWYKSQVFLAPSAVVRNPEVAKLVAEMKPVQPNYPDTLHGLFTGDLVGVRKSLKQLSDRLSAERERALKATRKKGTKVSLDDWAFPNWQPRRDFTNEMYS